MSRPPETRPSLLVRLKDQADDEAWSEFTEIYRPVIYRLVCRRGMQHADADDLVQQVLAAVARAMTRSGVIAGTPQFMSPEQARGDSVDRRSDLFSLGSVLYALCTGHAPFRAETSYGVLRRISDDRTRPIRDQNPEIPDWLCAIIDKLHAKAPAERYSSADDVSKIFEQCLAHVQQPNVVPLPDSVRRPRPALAVSSRRWLKIASLAIASAALLLATTLAWIAWNTASAPARRAEPVASESRNNAETLAPGLAGDLTTDPAHRWEDGTAVAIDELETEITNAEQLIDGGWDRRLRPEEVGQLLDSKPVQGDEQEDGEKNEAVKSAVEAPAERTVEPLARPADNSLDGAFEKVPPTNGEDGPVGVDDQPHREAEAQP